jgi:hypothetical protein
MRGDAVTLGDIAGTMLRLLVAAAVTGARTLHSVGEEWSTT